MPATQGTAISSPLYGLWLGGTVQEVRTATFVNKETKEERRYQIATVHLSGTDARYQPVSFDETTRFDAPKDQPVLINVRAYVSDNQLRMQLAKDHPSGFWMPSFEVDTADGELVPLGGLLAVADFHSLVKREWRDRVTQKLVTARFCKVHLKRPTAPDYLMLDLDDGTTLPDFKKGQGMTVPVTVNASPRGLRYRLNPEFSIMQPLTADPDQAAA